MKRSKWVAFVLASALLAGCGSGGGGSDLLTGNTGGGNTGGTGGTGGSGGTGGGGGGTTNPGTTIGGSLGQLQDIGDIVGTGGAQWYDTAPIGINDIGQIVGSSLSKPILWSPSSPNDMVQLPMHSGAYDDYFRLKTQPSKNTFESVQIIKINKNGWIIGNTFSKNGKDESRAFAYDSVNRIFHDLAPPSYVDDSGNLAFKNYSNVVDINDSNWVLLTAEDTEGKYAYYWDGQSTDLISGLKTEKGDTLPDFNVPRLRPVSYIIEEGTAKASGAEAVKINNNGEAIVHSGETAAYDLLGKLGAASFNSLNGKTPIKVVDINNVTPVGHVIGNAPDEGFFWDGGIMYPLGHLGGGTSKAIDLNNKDQVVGNSTVSGGTTHAFIWQLDSNKKGVMTDLGTLGGPNSYAVAVNDLGMVVGYSDTTKTYKEGNTSFTVQHAFLWYKGFMFDLGAHSPPNFTYPFDPDLVSSRAVGINENGVVTGYSFSVNTHRRGFTLTPVFPPNLQ